MKSILLYLEDDLKKSLDVYCAKAQIARAKILRKWIKEKLDEENNDRRP